jgi:hypothetical protein
MVMVSNLEIVGKVRLYLDKQLNLADFRKWVVCAHLEMQDQKSQHVDVDKEAAQFLAAIEGQYADFSDGIVSEDSWRERLKELLNTQSSQVFHIRSVMISTSSSTVALPDFRTSVVPGPSSVCLANK